MKARFMAAVMAVSLLMLLVQDIPLMVYFQQAEHDRIMTSLERDAFVLAGRSEESLESPDPVADAVFAETARSYREAGGARIVVVNAAGIAVVTNDDDQSRVGASYLSRPEIAAALAGNISSGHRYSETLGLELLYMTVPVFSGDKVLGAVRLTYPDQVVTDVVNGQLRMLGLVGLSTVLLAGIVGFLFSGTITRRLTALREATERLAEGDLTARADEKPGAPELRSVSKSFNRMAERLQTLLNQQKAFAADASHQLRTPLTALKLRLEMARELLETDPAAASTRLAAAEAEVDRMGNIIEGLLMLSRTEASSAPVVTVDLADIARDRAIQWEPLAEESGVRIRYEGPAHALVQAVSTAAEQIIDNYVDNALTQSPAGSEIVIRVVPNGADTTVHVLDQGPGLSPEECVRAFDRFWRAASDSRGSGLGLAIVTQLALASRATAALTPRDASVAAVGAVGGAGGAGGAGAAGGTAKSARPAKSRATTGPGLDASVTFVTSR